MLSHEDRTTLSLCLCPVRPPLPPWRFKDLAIPPPPLTLTWKIKRTGIGSSFCTQREEGEAPQAPWEVLDSGNSPLHNLRSVCHVGPGRP